MAENSTIARPYAEALLAATPQGSERLQACADSLQKLAEIVGMEQVRQTLSDPRFDDAQRVGLLNDILEREGVAIDEHLKNFVDLLVSNGRLLLLPEISAQFDALKDKAQGVAQAQIVSAFPMSDQQISELVHLLEPKFNKKLEPHVTVDETLIGGVRVVVGDFVLDTSVQAQLNRMRDALTA